MLNCSLIATVWTCNQLAGPQVLLEDPLGALHAPQDRVPPHRAGWPLRVVNLHLAGTLSPLEGVGRPRGVG